MDRERSARAKFGCSGCLAAGLRWAALSYVGLRWATLGNVGLRCTGEGCASLCVRGVPLLDDLAHLEDGQDDGHRDEADD